VTDRETDRVTDRETDRETDTERRPPDRGYLHQVDVVRLLTFGSVIAVHVIAATTPGDSVPARGVLMVLHFTRETFFVITGFVLFHTYYRRTAERALDARAFWRRRYLLIGVPYLVWSLVYWSEHVVAGRDGGRLTGAGVRTLGLQLLTGTAEYHLYFLLVSMQVYLVFPWLLRLVRATQGRPGRLLAVSAALQLAWFWFLHDLVPTWAGRPGWLSPVVRYAEQLLPSYLLYVVAGALAAVHLRRTQTWILAHGRVVAVVVVVGALLTEGVYLAQVATGSPPARASEVLQPVMVGWTLVLTVGLLAVGLAYARRRREGRIAACVREGSRISFGVFLVHPLVISALLASWPGTLIGRAPAPVSFALLWLVTVVVSVAVAEVAARTPLSLPLTGRRRDRSPRPEPARARHAEAADVDAHGATGTAPREGIDA
jgi:peptidoglycan/LPS O-acetylase OafA/YrhL